MDSTSEARLAGVHPRLAAIVRSVYDQLEPNGIVIRVTSGTRGKEEQDADYAKGRNADGEIVEPHMVVTHAPYGYSAHNFGMAIDAVPGVRGVTPWEPNWKVSSPDFQAMVVAFEQAGCVAGIRWPEPRTDADHFQLPGQPVTPTTEMRIALLHGGVQAVWEKFAPEGLS